MMVKEWIDNEEVEDGALYDTTVNATSNEENEQQTKVVMDGYDDEYSGHDQHIIKLVNKRWEKLYNNVGSKT